MPFKKGHNITHSQTPEARKKISEANRQSWASGTRKNRSLRENDRGQVRCTKCRAYKEREEFDKSKREKMGLNSLCKVCRRLGNERANTLRRINRRKAVEKKSGKNLGGLQIKDKELAWAFNYFM